MKKSLFFLLVTILLNINTYGINLQEFFKLEETIRFHSICEKIYLYYYKEMLPSNNFSLLSTFPRDSCWTFLECSMVFCICKNLSELPNLSQEDEALILKNINVVLVRYILCLYPVYESYKNALNEDDCNFLKHLSVTSLLAKINNKETTIELKKEKRSSCCSIL